MAESPVAVVLHHIHNIIQLLIYQVVELKQVLDLHMADLLGREYLVRVFKVTHLATVVAAVPVYMVAQMVMVLLVLVDHHILAILYSLIKQCIVINVKNHLRKQQGLYQHYVIVKLLL